MATSLRQKEIAFYTETFGREVRYSDATIRKAIRLSKTYETELAPRNPKVVAFWSLHIAGLANCEYKVKKDVAEKIGSTSDIVRNVNYDVLEKRTDKLAQLSGFAKSVAQYVAVHSSPGKPFELAAYDYVNIATSKYLAVMYDRLGAVRNKNTAVSKERLKEASKMIKLMFFE